MSFVLNSCQQISLFDSLGFLSERKLERINRSWARWFSDHIFTKIDETIFAPLYSSKTNSRPNAPINVMVGAMILKELNGLTDDEVIDECEFDFRFQFALHTTSFEEQPVSRRSFSRFRERVAAYELTTGVDLVHECVVELAEEIRKFMDIDPSIKRMDSMMIESNIKVMGRLELLYTCLSNLVKRISRDGRAELVKGFEHYADSDDRNRIVYYQKDIPVKERLQTVINDAVKLLPLCKADYKDTEDYQLLLRAVSEQTKDDGNGKGGRIPKTKDDGMGSDVLQNPADPDATYREKAGKKHHGYSANLTETVDEKGSVVTDYQYDTNNRSDSSFIKESIEKAKQTEETQALITDGAYSSEEVRQLAAEKNIGVLTTGLLGRKPNPVLPDFKLSEDGKKVTSCPSGQQPKACFYIRQTNSIRVSFYRSQCENCPHLSECNPKLKPRTAVKIISLNSRQKALEHESDEHQDVQRLIGRIRNGIETVPSLLRSKYHVDRMPVRRKLRTKLFFGFKAAAVNCTKLFLFQQKREYCRAFMEG